MSAYWEKFKQVRVEPFQRINPFLMRVITQLGRLNASPVDIDDINQQLAQINTQMVSAFLDMTFITVFSRCVLHVSSCKAADDDTKLIQNFITTLHKHLTKPGETSASDVVQCCTHGAVNSMVVVVFTIHDGGLRVVASLKHIE